jgi:hypothetical protein
MGGAAMVNGMIMIKTMVADAGVGFIGALTRKAYFFSRTGVDPSLDINALKAGESVRFEAAQSHKGPHTRHARLA